MPISLLPGVTFSQQKLLVVTDAAPYANYPARGIIGKTVFDCVVEIDYDESVLHLYDSAAYEYEGSGETFDFEFSHGIPVIDAVVSIDGGEDVPVKMLVDTGAAQLLLFTFSSQAAPRAPEESSRARRSFSPRGSRAPFAVRRDA